MRDPRLSQLVIKDDLGEFATKKDLERLEQRMNEKFGQVVDELDVIKSLLINGSKPGNSNL